MKNIEIPYVKDRGRRYRFFEMLPGILSWSLLALPFILSQISPIATVFFIIAYLLLWFVKALGLNVRAIQGFKMLNEYQKLPWRQMVGELESGKVQQPDRTLPSWHYEQVLRLNEQPNPVVPSKVIHAVVLATYNEAREVLEPTIQSVIDSDYSMKDVILVLAYEERGGPEVHKNAQELIDTYKHHFKHAMAVMHPADIPGEVIGKGGNITYAGRELAAYVEAEGIDPLNVIVTTLDADNRPHEQYFAALTYVYSACEDPLHTSFQPIPMFTNNIWDAPAPMRVIATGNTFWNVVISLRPHMIRNFSSHAQSLQSLIDTDFWSVRTIVEDGHQFWRTYFRYEGKHDVFPIFVPIYQDAVLSSTFRKTLKAQFVQLRRWAWGASDIAYVIEKGYFTPNKIPKFDLLAKTLRLIEGHVSWASAPIIMAFAGYIPSLFYPQNYAANELPHIASYIQTIALTGIIVTLFLSLKMLPPKPARYKEHRRLFMVVQWVMLPITTIGFNAVAALNSQTRLIFGKYLGKFDVTDKAVITEDNTRVM